MIGISGETPFRIKKYFPNLTISPNFSTVLTPGISNSNKISNEDSTNNEFSLENINRLNR